MTTVSISLTDEQAAELAALAQAQHKTPEEALAAIVQAALPASPSSNTPSVLDILGIFATGGMPDSRLHDQIIAEEAMNSHDDEN